MKAYRIFVSGLVQGVGFRFSTRAKASELGLDGYVKNLADGRVEICVSGKGESLVVFLDWCHDGPSSARVDKLEYTEIKEVQEEGFVIKR